MDRLSVHLKMLPDIIKRHGEITGIPIKKVTNIHTICSAKDLCCKVHHLLQIFLIIPATTSTSERTLSAMRRLKNYLRSTMTQQRLNHTLVLHSHKLRTDNMNLPEVAASFISANERRQQYFGKM